MKILIVSIPDDHHAQAVIWALNKLGHQADFIFYGDFPQKLIGAFTPDKSGELRIEDRLVKTDNYDIIWNRKHIPPVPPNEISKSDHDYIIKASQIFLDGLVKSSKAPIMINPISSKFLCDNKIFQLNLATSVGLRVPETLITNDPKTARKFVKEQKRCITKPLIPTIWENSKSIIHLPTSIIQEKDLYNDLEIQSCPMIYQKFIEKIFDCRVIVMQEKVYAIKIDSQDVEEAKIDYRKVSPEKLKAEYVKLDRNTENKILQFCYEAKLIFAVFDFVVDSSGSSFFLEVNEQGQFLWLDMMSPELNLFSHFINFVLNFDKSNEKDSKKIGIDLNLANYFIESNDVNLKEGHVPYEWRFKPTDSR